MRFVLERHTDSHSHCWRVLDTDTGERHGFGLTEFDAAALADQHEQSVRPDWVVKLRP